MLGVADLIWNRACHGGGESPRDGDTALASLLLLHGAIMNGGVFHGVECLNPTELRAAKAGYRYFGLQVVAELLTKAEQLVNAGADLEERERELNQEYARHIPSDSTLTKKFEERYANEPLAFSPIQ